MLKLMLTKRSARIAANMKRAVDKHATGDEPTRELHRAG